MEVTQSKGLRGYLQLHSAVPGPPRRPESTDGFDSFVEENRLLDSAGNARTVPVTSMDGFHRYLLLVGISSRVG